MPILVACPNCGRQYQLAEEHLGRSGWCTCGTSLPIPPAPVPTQAPPPAAVPPRAPAAQRPVPPVAPDAYAYDDSADAYDATASTYRPPRSNTGLFLALSLLVLIAVLAWLVWGALNDLAGPGDDPSPDAPPEASQTLDQAA